MQLSGLSFASEVPPVIWEPAERVIVPQINGEGLHEWPFEPTFPVDVRYFSVGTPCRMRMSRHSFFELAYVHRGAAELQIQDRLFEVAAGDLMVIGASLYHRIASVAPETLELMVVYFEPEVIQRMAGGEGDEYLAPFFLQSTNFPHVLPSTSRVPEEVAGLLCRLAEELPATTNRGRLAARTYLRMVLLHLVNHYAEFSGTQESFAERQRDLARLKPAFLLVEEAYTRSLRVQEAARRCGMSASHFMYFFKAVTGQPFLRYVNHFRIAKAQYLLTHTDASIATVTQELGFCDQSHFGVVFREIVGVSPMVYRRQEQGCVQTGAA